ncbi:Lrp/AsnC family transcriptional regulator [Rhizobium leguminosarum]|uniref:DNA-binding Lrp family transcriptional regulator n=1 Tax=Rhizobium leguminosarum TaxID=384 RepID=A0A7W9ZMS1_RHILE|nr:DNA-binding Lrp family transcriptional regulator [Rhizobium leguminosarum]
MKLDRIDIKILHELQKNGRVTNVELAELVNLSPSPCLMRVKKLQSEGYIEGYSAQINVAKLGQTLTVFTEITLKNRRQVDFARFLATIEKLDQVIECHLVSGGYDYLLKFVTAGIGGQSAYAANQSVSSVGWLRASTHRDLSLSIYLRRLCSAFQGRAHVEIGQRII